jgi:predicted ATP-dependent endonuclease of OLD family
MAEGARIRRIRVSSLFGIFDHDIPLNLEERITILHGPNGYGKTIMLRMLDALFYEQWKILQAIPFDEFVVELDNSDVIRVTRQPGEYQIQQATSLFCNGQNLDSNRLSPIKNHVHSHLIRTQRLNVPSGPFDVFDIIVHEGGAVDGQVLSTARCSSHLVNSLKALLTTYAARSQELDSSFLERLFAHQQNESLPADALHQRLDKIEEKRARLTSLGFLDHERDAHKLPPKLDDSKLDVLTIYVHDTERKLAVFEEMAQKVQLLTEAINKRFSYKRMGVSREDGFVFRSAIDDSLIPLGSLSSGEQHELVLLYELLFKVKPNTLVLIDEPEISLHLAWQQQFLDDLVEIVKLSSFDVLIATHSPGIIGKRWDLTVELKGPEPSMAPRNERDARRHGRRLHREQHPDAPHAGQAGIPGGGGLD